MTDTEARKAELQATADAALSELREIEEQEKQADLSKHVGKFYRYRNCYSCPQGPEDYWWLYYSVMRVGERVMAFQFQIDKDGRLSFETRPLFFAMPGMEQIGKPLFTAALQKAMRHISKLEEGKEK